MFLEIHDAIQKKQVKKLQPIENTIVLKIWRKFYYTFYHFIYPKWNRQNKNRAQWEPKGRPMPSALIIYYHSITLRSVYRGHMFQRCNTWLGISLEVFGLLKNAFRTEHAAQIERLECWSVFCHGAHSTVHLPRRAYRRPGYKKLYAGDMLQLLAESGYLYLQIIWQRGH